MRLSEKTSQRQECLAWVLKGRRSIQQDGNNLWLVSRVVSWRKVKQVAMANMHCTKDKNGRR